MSQKIPRAKTVFEILVIALVWLPTIYVFSHFAGHYMVTVFGFDIRGRNVGGWLGAINSLLFLVAIISVGYMEESDRYPNGVVFAATGLTLFFSALFYLVVET